MWSSEEPSATSPVRVERRGLVLILSSPSGAGKTTLTRALMEDKSLGLTVSVSVTTRAKRSSEIHGRDYHFIDVEDFALRRDRGELLEWAEVHGNFYGTPQREVERTLERGADMIFDIDYQGSRQVKAKLAEDVLTVFILPPSMSELKHRLDRRAEDTAEIIARRLDAAKIEIERWVDYDYVIVNDDLDRSYTSLKAILAAERLKRERLVGLAGFVQGLLSERIA